VPRRRRGRGTRVRRRGWGGRYPVPDALRPAYGSMSKEGILRRRWRERRRGEAGGWRGYQVFPPTASLPIWRVLFQMTSQRSRSESLDLLNRLMTVITKRVADIQQEQAAAPDDGLDIPPSLRRERSRNYKSGDRPTLAPRMVGCRDRRRAPRLALCWMSLPVGDDVISR